MKRTSEPITMRDGDPPQLHVHKVLAWASWAKTNVLFEESRKWARNHKKCRNLLQTWMHILRSWACAGKQLSETGPVCSVRCRRRWETLGFGIGTSVFTVVTGHLLLLVDYLPTLALICCMDGCCAKATLHVNRPNLFVFISRSNSLFTLTYKKLTGSDHSVCQRPCRHMRIAWHKHVDSAHDCS